MKHARYLQLPSQHLDRRVHMWTYGWWGRPVLVFPTASGMAHEWQISGGIEALSHLVAQGRIKLYCPESNVSEVWTESDADPAHRITRHQAYERFIVEELVPWIRADCASPDIRISTVGASMGAFYAANTTLKHPEIFDWALCLSGRYRMDRFMAPLDNLDVYYNHPLAYVPNLTGDSLARVAKNTSLTLVVGTGAFEGNCVEETLSLAAALRARGIPHERDIWSQAAHHWSWWKQQLVSHFERRF